MNDKIAVCTINALPLQYQISVDTAFSVDSYSLSSIVLEYIFKMLFI